MNKHLLFSLVFLLILSCTDRPKEEQISVEQIANPEHQIINSDVHQIESVQAKTNLELYLDSLGFVEITKEDSSIHVDLKYATTDNFTGQILYENLNRAYLHPDAATKLVTAQSILKTLHPNFSLLVFDGARPLSIQKKMFDVVKNTKFSAYVANPSRTGLHNYGMAVDLTICDLEGKELDMGTKFDFFGALAGINNEDMFLQQGLLSKNQYNNRKLLRKVMQQAGFIPIRGEWWHFNACALATAKQMGILIE